MLRTASFSILGLIASAASAAAHTGHVGFEAGHDHGVAYVAAGLAVIIVAGAAAFLQARR